ncbi:MAG: hypothetical protein H0T86_02740 [Gemmatimonadales bacterium]|nr:hypothetical protein [Gemmatimonadales bacterium]
MVLRGVILVAAVSLGAYIAFKTATHPHAFTGAYAVLFPLSIIVTIAGVVFAIEPALALRTPVWIRAAVGIAAAGWLANGMLCVRSLAETTLHAPLAGLFATGHMVLQHVVLTLGVAAFTLAPRAVYRWFALEAPAPTEGSSRAVTPIEA